jgi:hypothetical protein
MAMALLDFVKDRPSKQTPAVANQQQEKPETAKVEHLPASVKAQAVEAAHPAAQLMDKATQHRGESPAPQSGQTDGKEVLMHNQSAAGKSQEAMSPTDNHKAHTATQERSQSRGRGMER